MFVFRNFFSIVVFFITIVFVSACADNDSDIVNGVIMYDSSKIYPKLDVKLSDLADVSFIPLGGEDSINFLTSSVSITKNIYIDVYVDFTYKETIKAEKIMTIPIKRNDHYTFDIYSYLKVGYNLYVYFGLLALVILIDLIVKLNILS